jgi:hypothetical protein
MEGFLPFLLRGRMPSARLSRGTAAAPAQMVGPHLGNPADILTDRGLLRQNIPPNILHLPGTSILTNVRDQCACILKMRQTAG